MESQMKIALDEERRKHNEAERPYQFMVSLTEVPVNGRIVEEVIDECFDRKDEEIIHVKARDGRLELRVLERTKAWEDRRLRAVSRRRLKEILEQSKSEPHGIDYWPVPMEY